MKNRVMIAAAVAALVGAVWFAGSEPQAPEAADAPALQVENDPPRPEAHPLAPPVLPRESAAVPAGPVGVDAGSATNAPAAWKARWDGIPLDERGATMRVRGQAKAFNRALHGAVREELRRCADARPQPVAQTITMELFVEGTSAGYDLIGAEAASDGGLDAYTRRCLELAFEQQLDVPDAGTAPGQLYRFAYPLQLPGPEMEPSAPN